MGRPQRKLRIVGIGGGTGLSVLLSGLERHARTSGRPIDIRAIVSVADDGGSTGVLRHDLGIPAVGDLRNCIVALSRGNPLWNDLLQHRFATGAGIAGHALGNLIVAALLERSGSLRAAIDLLARPLCMQGRVLPVTEAAVTLCAELADGEIVRGESQISATGQRIARVWLSPGGATAADGVLDAIDGADAIVFGPGSLYTSIIPNLLVADVSRAIRESGALKIFVSNLMTQPGETDGFDATDHVRVTEEYLGQGVVDVCLVNAAELPPELGERYADAGSTPVTWRHEGSVRAAPFVADLLERNGILGRHDPVRLAEAIVGLAASTRRPAAPSVDAVVPAALLSFEGQPTGASVSLP